MNKILNIYKSKNGFTTLELMITLAIIAILVTLAYPVFINMLYNMEAKRLKNIIFSTLRVAKTTSYINHQRVFMCLTDDNLHCNVNGNSNLILFFDGNHNNNFEAASDSLISIEKLNLKYASVHLATGGKRKYVRFSKDTGTPRGFMGHIKYCTYDDTNLNTYKVSFNMVGLFRFKPNTTHPTGC